MNITCTACNNRKKEENFSITSLQKEHPTCSSCDLKSLQMRINTAKTAVMQMKKQQQIVKDVAGIVEKPTTKKQSSRDFLKSLLNIDTRKTVGA